MEMLDRQSLGNIVCFWTFFALFVAVNPVWLESCTPTGNVKKSYVNGKLNLRQRW